MVTPQTTAPARVGFGGLKTVVAVGATYLPPSIRLAYVYYAHISTFRVFFLSLMLGALFVFCFIPTSCGLVWAKKPVARGFTLFGAMNVVGLNVIMSILAFQINGPAFHYTK